MGVPAPSMSMSIDSSASSSSSTASGMEASSSRVRSVSFSPLQPQTPTPPFIHCQRCFGQGLWSVDLGTYLLTALSTLEVKFCTSSCAKPDSSSAVSYSSHAVSFTDCGGGTSNEPATERVSV